MQINKKILTTALTALLLLSMVAAIAPAFAAVDTFQATSPQTNVTVGQRVQIDVIDASMGGQLIVTWETVAGSVLSNSTTYAKADGTATIFVNIPSVAAGNYHLIVKDVQYGATRSVPITVIPKITLDPRSGLPGDAVTVTGSGFTAGKTISAINFNGVDIKPTGTITVSSTGAFTATVIVPTVAYGTYPVDAVDSASAIASTTFVVGAAITISQNSGPTGTVLVVNGRGFTPAAGSPPVGVPLAFRIYRTLGSVSAPMPEIVNIVTTSTGTFQGEIVVPTVPTGIANDPTSVYTIEAADGSEIATATFNVTATTVFTVDPIATSPWQNTVVDVTGSGYTAKPGTEVTFTFNGVVVGTITTSSTGAIVGEIAIPNLSAGYYNFVGTDKYGLTYTVSYQIGITLLVLNPSSGPTGTLVDYSAFGFHDAIPVNITLNGKVVIPNFNPTNVGGRIIGSFIIPTMPVGQYEVKITAADGLNAITTFTVTDVTSITVNPSQSPPLSTVALTAKNFGSGTALNFYIANSTWSTLLSMTPATGFSGTTTNTTGWYEGTFTLPAGTVWNLGGYTIIANNTGNTLNATTAFTIGAATFSVQTRSSQYVQGDIVSFKIAASYQTGMDIIITDPEGTKIVLELYTWNFYADGGVYKAYISYGNAIGYAEGPLVQLPNDAAVGTWTWTVTATNMGTRSGSFTVAENALGSINDKLDNMNQTLITIKTATGTIQTTLDALEARLVSIEGKVATLQTNIGTIQTSVSNLPSTISTSVQNGLATITTEIGTITTQLDSIDAVLGAVAGDVVTINTSVGTFTASLEDINAVVCSIEDGVATIQTDLGTVKGVVTEVKDGVATIQTSVGTISTNVSNLQEPVTQAKDNSASVSTMVYVAVAFALIAAIAAVASILLMRKKIAS
jgi:archaellum component FlaC